MVNSMFQDFGPVDFYLQLMMFSNQTEVEITKSKRFIDSPFLYDSIL